MARLLGIDIGPEHVRAVLLKTGFRTVEVEQLVEADLRSFRASLAPPSAPTSSGAEVDSAPLSNALVSRVRPIALRGELIAVSLPGEQVFLHELTLPANARRQLSEVLPFELEAQVPVEFDELVYAYRILPEEKAEKGAAAAPLRVLAGAARIADVRARLVEVRTALQREPERVGCGPLPLANLASIAPELRSAEAVALIDIGEHNTDIVVLERGEPRLARTLSRGYRHLPEQARGLGFELKQTLLAYMMKRGVRVEAAHLVGLAATDASAAAFLEPLLGVAITPLPKLELTKLTDADAAALPRFARAIGLALSLRGRPLDLDLRTGPVAFQRGYGYLKERAPMLAGLAGALVISYLFSAWADSRALDLERDQLRAALGAITSDVLGATKEDPTEASDLLKNKLAGKSENPMPELDAFDVLDKLSHAIPKTITHDVSELDFKETKLRISGVVDSKSDAQKVEGAVKRIRCLRDPHISKITQMVRGDKQRYTLEVEVGCTAKASKKRAKPSTQKAE